MIGWQVFGWVFFGAPTLVFVLHVWLCVVMGTDPKDLDW